VQIVDEGHDVDASLGKIAEHPVSKELPCIRVKKDLIEVEDERFASRWINARPAFDLDLLAFDFEKAHTHVRKLRFRPFSEGGWIEWSGAGRRVRIDLRINDAIDFGFEGKDGASDPNENEEDRQRQAGPTMQPNKKAVNHGQKFTRMAGMTVIGAPGIAEPGLTAEKYL